MQGQKFPKFHFELLNEIHNQRAARKIVDAHNFSERELITISESVGDMPTWERSAQPQLVADTLAVMAKQYPYNEN